MIYCKYICAPQTFIPLLAYPVVCGSMMDVLFESILIYKVTTHWLWMYQINIELLSNHSIQNEINYNKFITL